MKSFRRALTAGCGVAVTALATASGASAAKVETVARGLDNPRSVAVGPDGEVYVANAGRGGRQCQGKGDDRMCVGNTGRIVRFANGQTTTLAKGFVSAAEPGGVFATGVDGVSVSRTARSTPSPRRARPRRSSHCPPPCVARPAACSR